MSGFLRGNLGEAQMRQRFWFGVLGSLLAAVSVGLAAYASHAEVADAARDWLRTASLFGFGHGVALAALAPLAVRRVSFIGLAGIALGVLMFSGSLVLAALAGTSTAAAPVGGSLMMLGRVLHALGQWRR